MAGIQYGVSGVAANGRTDAEAEGGVAHWGGASGMRPEGEGWVMQANEPAAPQTSVSGAAGDDLTLLAALRAGDESAFVTLVERHHAALVRVARMYVHDAAVAQEVAQDTWLGVLNGIASFEPRASLKTWIFRILINRARTSATREGRSIPLSAAFDAQTAPDEPAVDPARFQPDDPASQRPGWWASRAAAPGKWELSPEDLVLAAETHACLTAAIAELAPSQREVITLRDIEGLTSDEVCNILAITETNQRVLLHRARSKVRQAVEHYMTRER